MTTSRRKASRGLESGGWIRICVCISWHLVSCFFAPLLLLLPRLFSRPTSARLANAPGSGDHYDISREYDIPLSLVPCDSAARFTWQDASLCAFLGNGVDFYVKNGRDYGFCVSPANAEESGMGNGDTLAVKSDPEFRMKFVTRLARADASELAEYGLPVKTGARQVWHP